MTFYKAFKNGVCALRERAGLTPLQGYVGKGQLFEYIEGTPLPTSFAREWIVTHDHEGNLVEVGPAPTREAPVLTLPAPSAAADRMAKARAARKPKAGASEPAVAGS